MAHLYNLTTSIGSQKFRYLSNMDKKINLSNPAVSIIIPTMNRKKSLLRTLRSISFSTYPKNKLEVMIIDNASSDSTPKMVRKNYPKFKLIENSYNVGFAPALNQGIAKSKGKYLLITNDDVIFDKNCLSKLVKLMESDKQIGIAGGKMFFRDPPDVMAITGFRMNIWLGYHPYDFEGVDKIREMDVATGGCMMIRRSVLDIVGPYDDGFFFCGEDYDLCFRVKIPGFKIMYCPSAIVWHELLSSAKKDGNYDQLFAHFRGKFRFMLIHASLPQMLSFLPIQLSIAPLVSYYRGRQITILPILAALCWNAMNISKTLQSRKMVNELKRRYRQ